MWIILKFIYENIKYKKLRSIIIIISIAASSGLFFSSFAISDTLQKMYLQQLKVPFGTAEIAIRLARNSPSNYFNTYAAENYKDSFDYVVGGFEKTAFLLKDNTVKRLSFNGFDLEDLEQMNPVSFEKKANSELFEGRKIILSNKTAQLFNLDINSQVIIEYMGQYYSFRVYGIAHNKGLFVETGDNVSALIPKRTMSVLNNSGYGVNTAYIKIKNKRDIGAFVEQLSKDYRNYSVRETISLEDIKPYLNRTRSSYMQLVLIVFFLSIFIIFTLFKVITLERLPVIGTFRSVGATKRFASLLLLVEGLGYGVIGGICGNLLGVAVLNVMARTINMPYLTTTTEAIVTFNPLHVVSTFAVALLITLIGSIMPIKKLSGLSVKEIVLGITSREATGNNILRTAAGMFLLVIGLIIPLSLHANNTLVLVLNVMAMIMLLIAIVLLTPFSSGVFFEFFKKNLFIHTWK